MEGRVLAIGAGRRQHHLDAGQILDAGDCKDGTLDLDNGPPERGRQPAGKAGLDQLLADRLDRAIGRDRDGRGGRRGELDRLRLGQSRAAIAAAAAATVEPEPAAAAADQEIFARRRQRQELLPQLALAGTRTGVGGRAVDAQELGRQPLPVGGLVGEHPIGLREPVRQRREALGALAGRQQRAVTGGDPGGQQGAGVVTRGRRVRAAEPAPERQLERVAEDQRGGDRMREAARVQPDQVTGRHAERQIEGGIAREPDAGAERAQLGPGGGQPDREPQMVGRALLDARRRRTAEPVSRSGPRLRPPGWPRRARGLRHQAALAPALAGSASRRLPSSSTASSSRSRSASVVR
jgi:hypothetical protein